MHTRQKGLIFFSLLIIASMILAACQTAATPTPERIVETVFVEGTPQIIEVTPTPDPDAPTPVEPGPSVGTGPIPADAMVACNPLPASAFNTGGNAHLAGLVAPGPSSLLPQPVPPTRVTQQITPQGDYLVGVFEDVTTINYWAANGPDNTVYNAYMLPDRLSLFSLSEKYFTFVPNAADVLEPDPLVEDGEFWVTEIPIRQDITWSDGTPFTAHDVAFTANAVVDLGLISGNWSSWYDANFLDHMEAVDDYTVRIAYHTKPGLARHEYGVLQAPILAAHYWEPIVEDALTQDDPTTALFAHDASDEPHAGAWLLDRWEPGASLLLTANPDYFQNGVVIEQWPDGAYRDSEGTVIGEPSGEPETVSTLGPHFEGVVYSIYGTQDAAILALRQGEVDFVLNSLGLQRGLADQIRGDANLEVVDNVTNGFRYLSFNNRRQPMNDCAFRQAVTVLIDKEFVTNTILQGVAFPLYTFVPEGNTAWYYDEVPMLGQGMDREARINLAIEILETAGFSWEGDQKPQWDASDLQVIPGGRLVMPDGTPVPALDLWSPSPGYDPLRSTFAIWIESWLNEMGIPVTAQLAGFNVLVPRIFSEQDFDMYILGWSLGIFPDYLVDFFSEEQAALEGNNAGGYINPEFEEASQALLTCESFEECKQISDSLQVMLSTEVPYVLLFDTGIIEAYRAASVQYPYTEQLSGLQYTHQQGALQTSVQQAGAE